MNNVINPLKHLTGKQQEKIMKYLKKIKKLGGFDGEAIAYGAETGGSVPISEQIKAIYVEVAKKYGKKVANDKITTPNMMRVLNLPKSEEKNVRKTIAEIKKMTGGVIKTYTPNNDIQMYYDNWMNQIFADKPTDIKYPIKEDVVYIPPEVPNKINDDKMTWSEFKKSFPREEHKEEYEKYKKAHPNVKNYFAFIAQKYRKYKGKPIKGDEDYKGGKKKKGKIPPQLKPWFNFLDAHPWDKKEDRKLYLKRMKQLYKK